MKQVPHVNSMTKRIKLFCPLVHVPVLGSLLLGMLKSQSRTEAKSAFTEFTSCCQYGEENASEPTINQGMKDGQGPGEQGTDASFEVI